MRRVRYQVATSLDGFIAGPHGEADRIENDPDVDFAAIWAQFDTGIMGRRTYEAAVKRLGETAFAGMNWIVFSRTLKPENLTAKDPPGPTIVSEFDADWLPSSNRSPAKTSGSSAGARCFACFSRQAVLTASR